MSNKLSKRFNIESPGQSGDWDVFVKTHEKGTIFHTEAMVRVYAAAKNHTPYAIAARDENGEIAALLVAVRVDLLNGKIGRIVSRSIFYAEPICRDDATGAEALAILIQSHDQEMAGVLFAEVRPIGPPGRERAVLEACGYPWQDYLNYIVDLRATEDEIYARFKKSVRKQLRRNVDRGMEVERLTNPTEMTEAHDHFQLSYTRSNVPLADLSLFNAAVAELPRDSVSVRKVLYNGEHVASSICLAYKDRMYAWYGGSHRIPGVSPDDSITWDEMIGGKQHGCHYYDFGGAGWPDVPYGPRDFKAKFGGELVCYGRYRKITKAWKFNLAKKGFETLQSLRSIRSSAR